MKSFSLHEPSNEARQTIESIMVDDSSLKLLPTHCINASGELEGFQLNVPASAKGGILPINRTMFHGTSLFEVNSTAGAFNADIMRLQQTGDAKARMSELMSKVSSNALGREVSVSFFSNLIFFAGRNIQSPGHVSMCP